MVADLSLLLPHGKTLWDVRKSLILLTVGTSFLYSAVNATMNIVNSIASEMPSLPAMTFLVYGIVQVVNSTFASLYAEYFKSRRVLLVAMVSLAVYVTCNIYISWWTYITAAGLLGFGYSLQWISGNIYCNEIGNYYADLLEEENKIILVRVFGVFNAAVQSGFLWGNAIVYFVLHEASCTFGDNRTDSCFNQTDLNETGNTLNNCDMCGATFLELHSNTIPQLQQPSQDKLYILSAVFICFSVTGCIMAAMLDNFSKCHADKMHSFKELGTFFKNLWRNIGDWQKLLLCPITVFIGMEQGFIMTEFTEAFVGCCMGISNIGLVMMCFGVTDTCLCLLQEFAVRACGRRLVMGIGIVAGLAALALMLLWKPNSEVTWMYYLLASLWAVMDSTLITQIFAIYGILFGDDASASFSVAICWVSFGFLIPFCYSLYAVEWTKIVVMMAVLVSGAAGYIVIEVKSL